MKRGRLILAIIVSVALVIVASMGSVLLYSSQRMVPQHSGINYVQGLNDTVEVFRDEWGIPHIYASNADDLFFAQGYVHAQDRWWQMEFQRHTGLGRIGELTGYTPLVVGNDLYIRTQGWNRAAAADLEFISEETRAVLEAYAAGVNAYTAGRHGGDLALEYTLLRLVGVGIEVEPWEPIHSISWAKVMSAVLGGNADSEMTRMALYEDLGEAMTDLYAPPYPFDERPTIVTEDDLPITADSLSATYVPVFPPGADYAALNVASDLAGGSAGRSLLPPTNAGLGSNNWVISGDNTASGMPLLANDMHLPIQMPSIWYEVGLHCQPVSDECPYDVVGFSFTGVPAVIVGHTQRIAWGVTNLGPDVQDLYILRVNPDDPLQYEYNGEWRNMEVMTEIIRFGDAYVEREDDPETEGCEGISGLPVNADGDLEIQVRLTHFGPIVTDNVINDQCEFVAQPEDEDPLALRWTVLEPGDLLRAVIDLNQAENWQEFREALTYWDWPAQNFVYADVDGNIGYQTPGKMPIRAADHSGLVPIPGWTDEYEWQGYIPFDMLPRILNPTQGWIVTANHAVVPLSYYDQLAEELGDDANYLLSQEWAYGYRAQRIVDMVSATGAHTHDTIAEIQGDNHNLSAEELLRYLFAIEFEDETLADAADWLRAWDLQNHMDSPQAALYEAFWVALVDNLWDDQLGFASGGSSNIQWATRLLMDMPDHEWWDDIRTEDVVEERDDILIRSLQAALDAMTATWGEDRDAWRWGNPHTATFVSNPLGVSGIGFIEDLVNVGPVATSGGAGIVNATSWSTGAPYQVRSVPSERVIIDLADFDASESVHTTGQGGHPFGTNYGDMVDDWRFIRYHAMNFSRGAVEEASVNRLELRPAPPVGASGGE